MFERTKNTEMAAIAISLFILIVGAAWVVQVGSKWIEEANRRAEAEEKARVELARKCEEAASMAKGIAEGGEIRLQWEKGLVRDPWNHQFSVENEKGLWETVTVTSPGPDGQKGTGDDIVHYKSKLNGIDASKAGESVGRSVGRFGIGAAKGLFNAAREQFFEEEKPDDSKKDAVQEKPAK
jgi:hypothetical protein